MLSREWTVGLEIDSVVNREDGEDCLAKGIKERGQENEGKGQGLKKKKRKILDGDQIEYILKTKLRIFLKYI
jgi:hypothetical protein